MQCDCVLTHWNPTNLLQICVLVSPEGILYLILATVPSLKDFLKAPVDVFLSRAVPSCLHICLESGSTCWESWAACSASWAAPWWWYMPQRMRRSPLWMKCLLSWKSQVHRRSCFLSWGWAAQSAPHAHRSVLSYFSPSSRFPRLCCSPFGCLLPPDLLPRTALWPEQHPHLPHHLLRYWCFLRVLSQGPGYCHQGLLCWPACAAAPIDVDPSHHAGGIHHDTN